MTSLLQEAAEWRMLGLLFECPSPQWRQWIAALAPEMSDPELRTAAGQAIETASEGVYHSILGPGGPAPAREVSYQETLQLGYLIAELSTYYEAFAYRPATSEALDHVSVEAGFIGYLRLKEAFARANGDDESAALAADAASRFLADHLSTIAQPLAASLAESGVPYLATAGASLAARTGPRRFLPVLQDPVGEAFCTDSVFDCGAAPA